MIQDINPRKIEIDFDRKRLVVHGGSGDCHEHALYSKDAFRHISSAWIKQEWALLHWQTFSWFGFPIWQLPEDIMRLQQVLFEIKPDVIIETGVNRGGSTVFFASICELLGKGRVISIDKHIPQELKDNIAALPFGERVELIRGDSVADKVLSQVAGLIEENNVVFVFLDSDHSYRHVLQELQSYSRFVTPGSYIVAADGVMGDLLDTPYGQRDWCRDNPAVAASAFVEKSASFILKPPRCLQDVPAGDVLTYFRNGWIYRLPNGEVD